MIFSIVENVTEHEKVQKLLVKGGSEEIATEMENIFIEMLKRSYPEELLLASIANAIDTYNKK